MGVPSIPSAGPRLSQSQAHGHSGANSALRRPVMPQKPDNNRASSQAPATLTRMSMQPWAASSSAARRSTCAEPKRAAGTAWQCAAKANCSQRPRHPIACGGSHGTFPQRHQACTLASVPLPRLPGCRGAPPRPPLPPCGTGPLWLAAHPHSELSGTQRRPLPPASPPVLRLQVK